MVYGSNKTPAWNVGNPLSAQFEAPTRLRPKKTRRQSPHHFPLIDGSPWTDDELGLVAHFLGREGIEVAPQLKTAVSRSLPPSPRNRVPRGAVILPKGYSTA